MSLHHRRRLLRRQPDRSQADGRDLVAEGVGAHHEHRRAGRQVIGEQLGGTLGAGHHIGGLGGESQFPQVRGNVFRGAGGVVGDEQGAGVGGFQRRDRPFGWSMAPEQGAVQVEQ